MGRLAAGRARRKKKRNALCFGGLSAAPAARRPRSLQCSYLGMTIRVSATPWTLTQTLPHTQPASYTHPTSGGAHPTPHTPPHLGCQPGGLRGQHADAQLSL